MLAPVEPYLLTQSYQTCSFVAGKSIHLVMNATGKHRVPIIEPDISGSRSIASLASPSRFWLPRFGFVVALLFSSSPGIPRIQVFVPFLRCLAVRCLLLGF